MDGRSNPTALPASARFEASQAARRARTSVGISTAGATVLTPFAINNFLQGRTLLGIATAGVSLCLAVNAVAGLRGRSPPIPAKVVFLPVLFALLISIQTQGMVGILWSFPAILLIHFILDARTSNFYNATIIGAAAPLIWAQYDGASAVRAGATLALVMVFANIFSRLTEAQQRQEAEQRERLDLIVRATRAGTLEWIGATEEVAYSSQLKEMLGYAPDADTSGWRSFLDFIHPEDRPDVEKRFRREIDDRSVKSGVKRLEKRSYRLLRADGEAIWIQAEAIVLTGADGRAQRYIASFIDMTDRHRYEEALRASRDQVEAQARQLEQQNHELVEAIRGREEVERMAQHDIRTPLNSIVAVPRLLRESPRLRTDEKELLGVVESAAYRILNLVNLTLDLYRMERGTYRFQPQAVDLLVIIDAVTRDLATHAAFKRVSFEVRVDGAGREGARAVARAEELLCYSILANLVKNAMEASPDGHPVRIEVSSGDPVSLRIHNAGVVPESIRDSFFEKYSTAGKAGGTGIGTYSARLMARVQNGDLAMETSEAGGTTLTLTLGGADGRPDPAPAPTPDRGSSEPALAPARVLLVDDDEYNLVFLRSLLPSPPLSIDTAINGRAAVARAETRRPDVIFMDLDMPVMDGFEALAEIRRVQAARHDIPSRVIAFSSYNDEATRQRALDAGFDHFLNKPARRRELFALLRGAVEAEGEVEVDPQLAATMPGFLATRRALAADILAAATAGRDDELRRLAHRLAGSLSLYGFEHAAAIARRLQDGGPSDAATLEPLARELVDHLGHVRIRIRNGSPGEAT